MAQVLLFTLVAVGLYFFADWIVRMIEQRRGEPLPNRSLVYFVVILVLAITSFEIIQRVLQGGSIA